MLLILEPDVSLLYTLERHFTQLGYTVLAARNGQEGLRYVQDQHPHLILLALRLGDIDGLDVLRRLRKMPRTSRVPVIVLAGHSEAMLRHRALQEGADDFIEKPLDLDILALRVRNALRRSGRDSLVEPRTGLPTGSLIEEQRAAFQRRSDWYQIELTLEHFDVLRDRYGVVAANEALRFAGKLIAQIVAEEGGTESFTGHYTNSERFLILTHAHSGPQLRDALARRIAREMASFYSFEERAQGYVVVEGSSGADVHKPLITTRIQVTTPEGTENAPPLDTHTASGGGESADSPFDW